MKIDIAISHVQLRDDQLSYVMQAHICKNKAEDINIIKIGLIIL